MRMRTFGKLSDGRKCGLYVLRNNAGMEVSLTDYGAAIVSLIVPDACGGYRDVVLGHSDAAGYENGSGAIGAVVGRFANRIGGASFELNGRRYELTANDGPNCLHGGRDPYDKRLWAVNMPFTEVSSGDIASAYAAESISDRWRANGNDNLEDREITFSLFSPDGDQGFPGNLQLLVRYTLTENNALVIDYYAKSDADTALNITNHSYFNLDGHDGGAVDSQFCRVNAERYTPVDENILPTGDILEVAGTEMDLRTMKRLSERYDINYVIEGEGLREMAALHSEDSGISMRVFSDLPGMQLYTADFLRGEPGKSGCVYEARAGVCMETQFFPDCVNKENFSGGILRAGEAFKSRTVFAFHF